MVTVQPLGGAAGNAGVAGDGVRRDQADHIYPTLLRKGLADAPKSW